MWGEKQIQQVAKEARNVVLEEKIHALLLGYQSNPASCFLFISANCDVEAETL